MLACIQLCCAIHLWWLGNSKAGTLSLFSVDVVGRGIKWMVRIRIVEISYTIVISIQ